MSEYRDKKWREFIQELPHRNTLPFSKKNWGDPNHSLCSYQGKLKPAIAHFLVKTFAPRGGALLDPFCGVGTIPFEASLNGIHSYGIDISPLAYYVSSAKVHQLNRDTAHGLILSLSQYINNTQIPIQYFEDNSRFGFNGQISNYYHPDTFREILLARMYFQQNQPRTPEECLVISALLHILHGNRPYCLSRKSHPIVPYAPSGPAEYKNLIEKLTQKVDKTLNHEYPRCFEDGVIIRQDSTLEWPANIANLDAIITSPPFFDSTKFYLANWIRLWFTGWDEASFDTEPSLYIDERQKIDFNVYDSIFRQARERLKPGGYFVMHLGSSTKCDMGLILQQKAKNYFQRSRLFRESVEECENFGITDQGSVTEHEYLIMD